MPEPRRPFSQQDAFEFEQAPDRRGSDSLKWARYAGRDVIPLWVADMDFPSPPAVIEALQKRVEHGVFGYAVAPEQAYTAVCGWFQNQYGWTIRKEWIVWLPGLVCGLNVVCRAFAQAGEEIAVLTPVYPPFLTAPVLSGRTLLRCPLRKTAHRYEIDFEQLERSISPQTRVVLFCHPHNPIGRIWSREELTELAELCLRKNLLLCSDEIHADLTLEENSPHIPAASLSAEIADRTITLGSPSKTFNLPGLGCAYAVIPQTDLRHQFLRTMRGIVPHVGPFGYTACIAAYQQGSEWLDALRKYLRENRDLVCETIHSLEGLSMTPPQATYLAWIDCRGLGLADPAGFFEEAGVGLSDGAEFDAPGYVRLNFACPKGRLLDALNRIRRAVCSQTL